MINVAEIPSLTKGTAGAPPKIPREDLHLIVELAETLTIREIAKKWEVAHESMGKYLKRHGHKLSDIKNKYRIAFVLANPKMKIKELAVGMGCSKNVVAEAKRRAKAQQAKSIDEGHTIGTND